MLADKIIELLNSSGKRAEMSQNNRDLTRQLPACIMAEESVCIFEKLQSSGAFQIQRQTQT